MNRGLKRGSPRGREACRTGLKNPDPMNRGLKLASPHCGPGPGHCLKNPDPMNRGLKPMCLSSRRAATGGLKTQTR